MKAVRIVLIICMLLTHYIGNSQTITWSGDIAPIIYENCAGCHHNGGIAPFPLMNYLQVYSGSHSIKHVIEEGSMPPWPADPNYMHFANETVLEQEEIDKLIYWIEHGMPSGDLNFAPDPPEYLPTGSVLDTIDYTVQIPPYTLQSNLDEYRWFVIEAPFDEDVYVSKIEVFPTLDHIVHHADLHYDLTGNSLNLDNSDPLPGFNGATGGFSSSHYINAWQPGGNIVEYPDEWGIKIPAGADLLVEIHYGPGGIGEVDETKMNIEFVKSENEIRPVKSQWILNGSSPILIDGPLIIPANQVRTFHQESYPLSNDMSLISICPHMHFLGKSYKVWYEDPDGIEHPLIDIPHWDFHWQKYYTYQNIKKIPAGSIIKSEGVYDNTSANHDNPFDPPQTAYNGLTTMDEMFLTYFIFADYEEGDENIVMDEEVFWNFNLEDVDENLFNLYPNPNSGQFVLSGLIPDTQEIEFHVYNSQGEIVDGFIRTSSRDIWYEEFDLGHLSAGVYTLEYITGAFRGQNRLVIDE